MPDIQWVDVPVVDAEVAAPSGKPCEACATPVEPLDRFCPACGTVNPDFPAKIPLARPESEDRSVPDRSTAPRGAGKPHDRGPPEPSDSPLTKHLECKTCGAEVATDPNQRSYVCPFCDSTYVVEVPAGQSGRQRPEFVIGFAVTPEQAQEKFRAWLAENTWYRPGDLAAASIADKMKGIYLPFWSFSMLAQSQWQAQIGEHWYRTEHYTTCDAKGNVQHHTRRVQETEWWPLSGRHHRYYSGYLVSGSRGLPQDQSLRIQPFNLPALKRYEPYFLAGWLAEEYSVGRDEALKLCHEEFHRQEQRNIAAFLPGDTHSGLAVETDFSHEGSDLCLLPIYILSYRYQDKVYRFLINGQTGRFAGDKPISGTRIGIAVGVALGLIALIVVVVWILSSMR
ncbi:MAG: zinc ribbon domain-containing protein [Planctomycetaceae bacterium]|nr:zinc ribbon domain-containing protein [Planctomycetaceae bacterium]